MRKRLKGLVTTVIAAVLTASMSMSAFAASAYDGYWETDAYIWRGNDGTVIDVGKGPAFHEEHPEITDPEYYLKEYICYPGEAVATRNSAGQPKASYTAETLRLLQEFVNSFDWIHSTEAERFKAIYDRIGVGNRGNIYEASEAMGWKVLNTGRGVCMDYTREFASLAKYVGMECTDYVKSELHSANLIRLNGHWFSTDPSAEGFMLANYKTYPVDYETELNRFANEVKATDWYQKQMQDAANQAEWEKQLEAGLITKMEYRRLLFPEMTDEEINEYYSWDGYVEGLGN